eukprot:6617108-Prymnesium_polylepis.1
MGQMEHTEWRCARPKLHAVACLPVLCQFRYRGSTGRGRLTRACSPRSVKLHATFQDEETLYLLMDYVRRRRSTLRASHADLTRSLPPRDEPRAPVTAQLQPPPFRSCDHPQP